MIRGVIETALSIPFFQRKPGTEHLCQLGVAPRLGEGDEVLRRLAPAQRQSQHTAQHQSGEAIGWGETFHCVVSERDERVGWRMPYCKLSGDVTRVP